MRVAAVASTALALCAILFSLISFARFSSASPLLSDFRGFYCAAALESRGVDPYRQEPLYDCEARPTLSALWHASGNVTDPAPLPPYALAAFVPLTLLPYGAAAAAWCAVLLAAWILTAFTLRRLGGVPVAAAASCVVLPAMMSMSLGQIAPLAIAAMCAAALLLAREQEALAGAAAAIAMVEPHVALPSCVALFLAVPRARFSLLGVGIAMLALSAAFGLARNAEYLLAVLPAHAISDVPDVGQFSTTVLAHVAGLPDAAAERIGSVWYALLALLGVLAAFGLRKRCFQSWPIVFVPMAFAVFGGAYVHWQQVVAALPAAVMLYRYRNGSPLLVAAVAALAIPWMYVVGWGFLIPGAVAVAATIVWQMARPSLLVESAIVAATFCALVLSNQTAARSNRAQPPFVATVAASDLADVSWGEYVRARIPIGTGIFFWWHFATWGGAALVVLAGAREGLGARYDGAGSRSGSAQVRLPTRALDDVDAT